MFDSIHAIVAARILHGFGFGLSTTFAAAIVADVIPASRRGEGIGYFGLGSTVMMALAPAVGLFYSMTSAQQPCSLPRPPFPSWLSLPVSSVMPARKSAV